MPRNDTAEDIQTLKRQLAELQTKLEKSQKITTALITGEREENLIYKWTAPTRVYIKRDRQWYWIMLFVLLIIVVVCLIFGEPMLILVTLSIGFVLYVSSIVPPENTEHQITNLGVRTLGELYTWDMMKVFWVSYKNGRELVNIDTTLSAPSRIMMLYSADDKPRIIEALKQKVKYLVEPKKQGRLNILSEGTYLPLADVEATMMRK